MSFSDRNFCPLSVVIFLKTFQNIFVLSRTTGLISTKLGTSLGVRDPGLLKMEPRPFPRKLAKKFIDYLKIFRTTGPISTKLHTKHPWVIGIQVPSNEGSC